MYWDKESKKSNHRGTVSSYNLWNQESKRWKQADKKSTQDIRKYYMILKIVKNWALNS